MMNDEDSSLWASIDKRTRISTPSFGADGSTASSSMLQVFRQDGTVLTLPYSSLRRLRFEPAVAVDPRPKPDTLLLDISDYRIEVQGDNLIGLSDMLADHRLRILRLAETTNPLFGTVIHSIRVADSQGST